MAQVHVSDGIPHRNNTRYQGPGRALEDLGTDFLNQGIDLILRF
jgi:hypothetical protein